jgi:hypothetical protein
MVVVELRGLEPLTFSMPLRRAPNCATAPRYPSALKRGNDRHSATTTPLALNNYAASLTVRRCSSQASSAFPRSPSAPCQAPTFAQLSVGMAYCSRSQLFMSSPPKHSHDPTRLVLYHRSAFSANLPKAGSQIHFLLPPYLVSLAAAFSPIASGRCEPGNVAATSFALLLSPSRRQAGPSDPCCPLRPTLPRSCRLRCGGC